MRMIVGTKERYLLVVLDRVCKGGEKGSFLYRTQGLIELRIMLPVAIRPNHHKPGWWYISSGLLECG
jgi:hypothetical protein